MKMVYVLVTRVQPSTTWKVNVEPGSVSLYAPMYWKLIGMALRWKTTLDWTFTYLYTYTLDILDKNIG